MFRNQGEGSHSFSVKHLETCFGEFMIETMTIVKIFVRQKSTIGRNIYWQRHNCHRNYPARVFRLMFIDQKANLMSWRVFISLERDLPKSDDDPDNVIAMRNNDVVKLMAQF